MQRGNFSVSLSVADIGLSRVFHEKVVIPAWGGDPKQNWLILKSDTTSIGLFRGMFEHSILTFNPGCDSDGKPLADFADVRDPQLRLQTHGVTFDRDAAEVASAPARFTVQDPDWMSMSETMSVSNRGARGTPLETGMARKSASPSHCAVNVHGG